MNTGTRNNGGTIVTATGLVFIAATTDGIFRAFDAQSGKILWSTKTDGPVRANPMTFKVKNGKQYVVVYAASAGAESHASVIAYALP
jgi:quinoprotein glucose dehydrogenase